MEYQVGAREAAAPEWPDHKIYAKGHRVYLTGFAGA
jgi:hypothetical protein